MTIKHSSGSGKTVITLDWTETRQFISLPSVADGIRRDVEKLVKETAPTASGKAGSPSTLSTL